jgi:hypothetical protein
VNGEPRASIRACDRAWLRVASRVHGRHSMLRLVVVLVALIASRPADACTCMSPKTTCEAVRRAGVIFVGTVKDVTRVAPNGLDVTVAVDEVFWGALGKTAVIEARGLGGSCDYGNYPLGEKLLLFANARSSGVLSVMGCSRSGLVKQRASELAELRAAAARGTGHVSGRVAMADGTPRANIEVRVASRSLAVRTDADGRYALELPPGKHAVEPDGDPALAPRTNPPVEVLAPGACVTRDFIEQWNGRIAGTVVDRNGKPVGNALVRAFPPSAKVPLVIEPGEQWLIGASARTNAKGEYELGPLAPGTYRVAIGAPFDPVEPYPATAHPTDITLGRGTRAADVDFVVPPRLRMYSVRGRITLAGNVPQHVNLDATLTETRSKREYRRFRSTHPVSFDFTEAAGAIVELKVCANELDCVTSKRVRVDKDLVVDLVLTLTSP